MPLKASLFTHLACQVPYMRLSTQQHSTEYQHANYNSTFVFLFHMVRKLAVFGCDTSMVFGCFWHALSFQHTPSQLAAKTMVISASVICPRDWSVPDYSWATSCQELSKAFFSLFSWAWTMSVIFLQWGLFIVEQHAARWDATQSHSLPKNNGRREEVGSSHCTLLIRVHLHPTLPEA